MPTTETTRRLQRHKRIFQDLVDLKPEAMSYKALIAAVRALQARANSAILDSANRGNPDLDDSRKRSADAIKEKSRIYVETMLPVINLYRSQGCNTTMMLMEKLNASHVEPYRGGVWTYNKVRHLERLIKAHEDAE